MNTLATFTALLLVGMASTAPHSDVLHIIDEMFPEELAIYTGEDEITQIVIPLNALNFVDEPEDEDAVSSALDDTLIFFIEKGKGINALKNKAATQILANGNDITATADEGKQVFFAATDGIYTYNAEKKTAEKYGTLTDNIIGIAVANGTDELYILTDNHVVYKVNQDGNHKEEIKSIKNARQIVLDSSNNLYYVDDKKQVNVYLHEDGTVKKIKGLPAHRSSVQLLRPPVVIDDSVPVIVGKKAFLAYANGTSEFSEIVLDTKPSAFSLEASLLLFVSYNNKIYEYNLLNIMLAIEAEATEFSSVKTFFGDQASEIQTLATKPINSIRV